MSSFEVGAVVVTRNRRRVLEMTLAAVDRQEQQPDVVIVVDNASDDGTREWLHERSGVIPILLDDNTGYPAGLAVGIEEGLARGCDACWLLDDDSRPDPGALVALLQAFDTVPGLGIVGLRGGRLNVGVIRHLRDAGKLARQPALASGVRKVDFVLVDGALVSRGALEAAGLPREDFFQMLEDVELSWRIGRNDFVVATLENELIERSQLGSTPSPGTATAWRRYYQSRNHVRWALDSGSLTISLGCALRQARFLVAELAHPRARRRHLHYQIRGMLDGFRGRMGRTVEPGTP